MFSCGGEEGRSGLKERAREEQGEGKRQRAKDRKEKGGSKRMNESMNECVSRYTFRLRVTVYIYVAGARSFPRHIILACCRGSRSCDGFLLVLMDPREGVGGAGAWGKG